MGFLDIFRSSPQSSAQATSSQPLAQIPMQVSRPEVFRRTQELAASASSWVAAYRDGTPLNDLELCFAYYTFTGWYHLLRAMDKASACALLDNPDDTAKQVNRAVLCNFESLAPRAFYEIGDKVHQFNPAVELKWASSRNGTAPEWKFCFTRATMLGLKALTNGVSECCNYRKNLGGAIFGDHAMEIPYIEHRAFALKWLLEHVSPEAALQLSRMEESLVIERRILAPLD